MTKVENTDVVPIVGQLRRAIWDFSRGNKIGISEPSAILMNHKTFIKLFCEEVYHQECNIDNIAPGSKFMGIPIYRTTDVENFKVL